MLSEIDAALVIAGHGSTLNPDSAAPTWAWVDRLREQGIFREVHAAFWKEEPSFRQVFYSIESREIFIVPNFISEGYFTQKVIPREFELTGAVTEQEGKRIHYCDPVGSHPKMTEILLQRALEIAPGVPLEEIALLIVGHGTALNDLSAIAAKREVERIRQRYPFGEVLATYMEEPPLVSDWARLTTKRHVVVVPFFISDGLHSYQDIPVLLGIEAEPGRALSEREVFRHNPREIQGRLLYFTQAIGTHPAFAEVILDQVRIAAQKAGWGKEAEAEGASFFNETMSLPLDQSRFGEILLIRRGEGERVELRHWQDRDHPELLSYAPEEARRLALYDDKGNFRPLKTAANLRRGWRIEVEGKAALAEVLEAFYPWVQGVCRAASRGRLNVIPLRKTLERQSGMYAITRRATPDQIQEAMRNCCAHREAVCLKQILWDFEGTEKRQGWEGAPETFLCSEACNLLVSRIRDVQKREP